MKRLFILSLVATIALASCTTNKCHIEGRLGNFAGKGMIYITNAWDDRTIIDSTTVDRGVFCFKNVVSEPTLAMLVGEDGSNFAMFMIEPGRITISGDTAAYDIKASGSPANDAFIKFMEDRKPLDDALSKARIAQDAEAYNKAAEAYDELIASALKANYSNVFGLMLLQQLSYSESAGKVLAELEKMPELLRQTTTARNMKAKAEQRRKTEPQAEGSDYVPYYINIEQPTPAGKMISLKEVVENKKNRYLLLDFWASWCGPCMKEIPHLTKAYAKYHKRGFEIYGVSFDRERDAWVKAIKKNKLNWINVSTIESFNNKAAEEYAVSSIPTNFLIDCSTGVIIAKNLRGEEVAAKLAELLK